MTLADAGLVTGAFRSPRNTYQGSEASIHNDATASKLGFRGGTVPGSIHMDQFVPMLAEAYGQAWFERGGLSTYFTKATVDAEAVQASLAFAEPRSRLTMADEAGARILEGTASLTPRDPDSDLRRRMHMQDPAPAGSMRILAALTIGETHHDLPVAITPEQQATRLATITEPLAIYEGEAGVLPPSQIVHLAHQTRATVLAQQRKAVGLFGALETQVFGAPLRVGVAYRASTQVLKLTQSPKTENVWYEVVFREPGRPEEVGYVLYYLRFMKASSPLWQA